MEIDQTTTAMTIRTEARRGAPGLVDLVITAPSWMPLDLSGVNTHISVAGSRGPISVETVQGEVDVDGGDGLVSLRSVQGSVTLKGAKGRLEVNSVNEDVTVSGSSGEVTAETVNGSITLSKVDATSVTASSVNGDLDYDGPIRNGGRYAFSTHNGDITVTVPAGQQRRRVGIDVQWRVRLRVPGDADRDQEGPALQLHHRAPAARR